MGAVYRAWDSRLDIPVAIKEMAAQPGLPQQKLAQLRNQFEKEAKVLARLHHPHLVGVTDFFAEGDQTYLVMKYVEGESLARRIEKEGMLSEEAVLAWAGQLLSALAYCHRQGIIHRDVKPQNVIIRPDGQAVLVDFGLVKMWDPDDPRTRTAIRSMGTPQYAPPEQYDAHLGHTDARSDIYSLGATLYHALSGRVPPTATQRVVDPTALAPLETLNPGVTASVAAVVARSLALQPGERYQSAAAMAEALGRQRLAPGTPEAVEGRGRGAHSKKRPDAQAREDRRRLPVWVWAVGGLLGLAAAVLVAGLVLGIGGRAVQSPPSQTAQSVAASPTRRLTTTPGDESPTRIASTDTAPTESAESVSTTAPTPTSPTAPPPTESIQTATPAPTSTPAPTTTPLPPPTETPPPSPTPTQPPTPTWTPTPSTPTSTGLRVTGRVLWGSEPVPGARIELKEQGNYYSQPILAQTTTSLDGQFALENPPAGDYQIYAVSPSEDYWKWAGRSIQIPVGSTVDVGTFYLKKKLQLLEPANEATVSTTSPTLRWSSFPNAARYHVNLFVDQTGDAVLREDTTGTSLAISTSLSPGVRYQWSVDAYDPAGVTIAYFSAWTFTVE
jgi:serine/threonine protein kinase